MATKAPASERAVSFQFLQDFISTVPEQYTTADVVFKLIVPATEKEKCPYVNLIDLKQVSKPNYFVSHRWGCKFSFIFERIASFMIQNPSLKKDTTFFWVDIFAINQHPGEEQAADLGQLGTAINLSTKTLLCLDETGGVLTRIWCLYEIWKTISCSPSRLQILTKDLNSSQVGDVFLKFHVDKAQATVESDRTTILNDITQHIGTQEMTLMVKENMLKSSLLEFESIDSSNIQLRIEALINCCTLHALAGQLEVAQEQAKLAVDLAQHSEKQQLQVTAMNNLAEVKLHSGQFEEAEKVLSDALELGNNIFKEDNPLITTIMCNLAGSQSNQGKHAEAETLHRRVLAQRQRVAPNSPEVAASYNNLAASLIRQGSYADAEKILRESLEFQKKILGEEHANIGHTLNNLAEALYFQGKFAEAETIHKEALILRKRMFGEYHSTVVVTLTNLANTLVSQGNYPDTESYQKEALKVAKIVHGDFSAEVKSIMTSLAFTLLMQGKNTEAQEIYQVIAPQ